MTDDRLRIGIAGFSWYVFPVNCFDVLDGTTPGLQDTPPAMTEYRAGTTSACIIADFAVNGLIVVTRQPSPPKPPAGWICQEAKLPANWSFHGDDWTTLLMSESPLSGLTWSVFEVCPKPNPETCDHRDEPC